MTLLNAITHLRTRCLAKADEFAELDALVSGAKTYSVFAAELDRLLNTVQLDTAQMPPITPPVDTVRSLPAEAVRRRQRQQHLRREMARKRISGTASADAIQEIARPATDGYDPDADARFVADLRAKGGKQ
jgi:hypothetical protein